MLFIITKNVCKKVSNFMKNEFISLFINEKKQKSKNIRYYNLIEI